MGIEPTTSLDIIKVNQQKEVEIGVADANSDYLLYDELKKELTIIETIIEVQMFLN